MAEEPSTSIDDISYDEARQQLTVTFTGGADLYSSRRAEWYLRGPHRRRSPGFVLCGADTRQLSSGVRRPR